MTPDSILACDSVALTQQQRESYFRDGYLLIEKIVSREWIGRLLDATDEMVGRSASLEQSDAIFDLEPEHSSDEPRLRRLSSPAEHHPVFWEFASQSVIADVASDLVGSDVKFHHSKLNFKWASGGEEVKWHQDITYWPHTNYSPLTIGLYLHDVSDEQGPLAVVPGSHNGPLYNQYDGADNWVGCLSDEDARQIDPESVRYLAGPAGSITVHNCRLIHGSRPNLSDRGRPLLLNAYASADAFAYTPNPLPCRYDGAIVRGKGARWAHHDDRPCLIPPDWSGGYTSLYAMQQKEDWAGDQMETVSRQTATIRGAGKS